MAAPLQQKEIYHIVYEIWNPLTLECFYVGKGNTRRLRYKDHINDALKIRRGKKPTNPFKAGTILKLIDMQVQPVFIEIERYTDELDALNEEKRLIAHYGRRNIGTGTLTNLTDGGEGTFGHVMPEEAKIKIGNAFRGKKLSDEFRAKLRVVATGRKYTEETKKKISDFNKTKRASEETKEKMRVAMLGRKMSEEFCAKVTAGLLKYNQNNIRNLEWREKQRQSKLGKPWSQERLDLVRLKRKQRKELKEIEVIAKPLDVYQDKGVI